MKTKEKSTKKKIVKVKKKIKKKKTLWDIFMEHQKKPFLFVSKKYEEEVFG